MTRYLKAVCGTIEDWPARLEFYKNAESVDKEDLLIRKILFTDVECVSYTERRHKEIITIRMQESEDSLSFYADTRITTMQWYRFCALLFKIPKCAIPEIPRENFALQQGIDQYSDSHKHDTGAVFNRINYEPLYYVFAMMQLMKNGW